MRNKDKLYDLFQKLDNAFVITVTAVHVLCSTNQLSLAAFRNQVNICTGVCQQHIVSFTAFLTGFLTRCIFDCVKAKFENKC